MKQQSELDVTALANRFWRDGYIVIEDFFDQSIMQQCQTEILSHYGTDPKFLHDENFIKASKTEVIPWFPKREGFTFFDPVETQSSLVALTQAILGKDWASQYCMVMFSKKGTSGQAWHQDCPPENAGLFNLNRLVYTMDVTDSTGGEVYIKPGTHKSGALTEGPVFEDFDDQVKLMPKRGTLVLLHGHCWHRIGEIRGDYRVSTNFRAAPKGVPDDITDICVYRNMRYQFSTAQIVG
jgi:ectoine hydroxylase-related dioxygenase (phytanoyl-CoA dioxygenase family)